MEGKRSGDKEDILGCLAFFVAPVIAFFAFMLHLVINDKSHLQRWAVTQNGKTYVSKQPPTWHSFTYTVWTDGGEQVILSAANGEIVIRKTYESEAGE